MNSLETVFYEYVRSVEEYKEAREKEIKAYRKMSLKLKVLKDCFKKQYVHNDDEKNVECDYVLSEEECEKPKLEQNRKRSRKSLSAPPVEDILSKINTNNQQININIDQIAKNHSQNQNQINSGIINAIINDNNNNNVQLINNSNLGSSNWNTVNNDSIFSNLARNQQSNNNVINNNIQSLNSNNNPYNDININTNIVNDRILLSSLLLKSLHSEINNNHEPHSITNYITNVRSSKMVGKNGTMNGNQLRSSIL